MDVFSNIPSSLQEAVGLFAYIAQFFLCLLVTLCKYPDVTKPGGIRIQGKCNKVYHHHLNMASCPPV